MMKTHTKLLIISAVAGLSITTSLLLAKTLYSGEPGKLSSPVIPQGQWSTGSPGTSVTITGLPADFPAITITVPASNTADGYIFLSAFRYPLLYSDPTYELILDNAGQPIYYRKAYAHDFKIQQGNLLTFFDAQAEQIDVLDNTYSLRDVLTTTQGRLDHHDSQLLANGHALIESYETRTMDMSHVVPGGSPTATVIGFDIQELNPAKNVVFDWDSWSHLNITDTVFASLTDTVIDYAHLNTLEPDLDGNLLILARNMNSVIKINRQTGAIMWRLGGKHNEFTIVNDPEGFSRPHDVRRLPNGHLTIFDNGVYHVPPHSRGIEYEIDETNKVITLVQQYRNTPDTFADTMGKVQRLPNGNTLVGWGSANPTVTEFRPDGTKAFEFTLPPGITSYRAFRFTWHARPATPPLLEVQTNQQSATLSFSWNGATDIQYYRIYEATSINPASLVYTATRTGFETVASETNLAPGVYFYRVTAVDNSGNESPFSNEVAVDILLPRVYMPNFQP